MLCSHAAAGATAPRTEDAVMPHEKADEVLRLDRLDLSPQAIKRQPVNPCEQPPIAPLGFVISSAKAKLPANGEAASFQRFECGRDRARLDSEGRTNFRGDNRSAMLKPPSGDLYPSFGPLDVAAKRLGQLYRRFGRRLGERRLDERPVLSSDPERRLARAPDGTPASTATETPA